MLSRPFLCVWLRPGAAMYTNSGQPSQQEQTQAAEASGRTYQTQSTVIGSKADGGAPLIATCFPDRSGLRLKAGGSMSPCAFAASAAACRDVQRKPAAISIESIPHECADVKGKLSDGDPCSGPRPLPSTQSISASRAAPRRMTGQERWCDRSRIRELGGRVGGFDRRAGRGYNPRCRREIRAQRGGR